VFKQNLIYLRCSEKVQQFNSKQLVDDQTKKVVNFIPGVSYNTPHREPSEPGVSVPAPTSS
jgi:hypothetical protein